MAGEIRRKRKPHHLRGHREIGLAADERGGDDQKRTMTLAEAFRAGADHIVVGRPIRHAADPRAAAEAMQAEIARLFAPPR